MFSLRRINHFLIRKGLRNMATLSILPQKALMDEPVKICVEGLAPGQPVTLAAMCDEGKVVFASYGQYEADGQGQVDLEKASSVAGSYTGVEPMGLFWSMSPQRGASQAYRMRRIDSRIPHVMKISVLDGHVPGDHEEDHQGPTLDHVEVERGYLADHVKKIPYREGSLRGTLFVPNGEGRHPGLLDMYGTGGGLAEYRGALLASKGYTVLALAFFAYEDLPKELDVPYEYFEEAIERLSSHANVIPGGIGAVGLSKGGEMSLLCTLLSNKVKAAVAINNYFYTSTGEHTHRGKRVPTVWPDASKLTKDENGAIVFQKSYNEAPNQEAAALPLHEIPKDTQLLLMAGADDNLCDAVNTAIIAKRLKECGHTNFSAHIFQDAGHLLEPPYMPHCLYSKHPWGINIRWGGKKKSHAYAQMTMWEQLLRFLKETLPHPTVTSNKSKL